jgi:hypothetical protein
MPAEVLVMCPACGRPQFPAAVCMACGQALPAPDVVSPTPTARERVMQAFEPYLEASLPGDRQVLLSERRLEWKDANGSVQWEVTNLQSISLQARPIWEALLFSPLFALLLLASVPGLRLTGALLVLVSMAACFLQRRYVLAFQQTDGTVVRKPVGFGRRKTPAVEQIFSVWASLSQELFRRGVAIREQT